MIIKNGKAYTFNGHRIYEYRTETEMTPVEFAAKGHAYLSRYFKAVTEGAEKRAAILLNAAESCYKKAQR